ncbi:hypothetical protein HF086_010054 [Spodoptera exigua]|uniref:Peptidase M14 domain-containing protein n=1 Tax=Spodoptera exigua TaxID=7107 RepID=A0A922N2E6_SPOEX|nr:hypothetical protein HF086_010054 [Spodoptera exigua]
MWIIICVQVQWKMLIFLNICFCLLFIQEQSAQITKQKQRFENCTIYEVTAFNTRERALLYYLYVKNEMLVFLNGITNEAAVSMDVVVDKCCTTFFEEKLSNDDIEFVKINEKFLINSKENLYIPNLWNGTYTPNITKTFYYWNALKFWIDSKVKHFPKLTKIKIGETYEKREIIVLKISSGHKKSAVFLLGGEEGRDRMSSAVLLNFIDYMLQHKLNIDMLLKHHDFYILPMLNPDGHDYNMKEFVWSRNRNVYFPKKKCPKNLTAIGINLDRNWYLSKETLRNDECDPVFSGSKSLSEEETSSLAIFLNKHSLEILAFINIRSFNNLVTIPYGYTTEQANNYPILMEIMTSVHEKVKEEHSKSFFYGATSAFFYNYSGNVADWVKKKLNTPIVYTIYMKNVENLYASPDDIQPMTDRFCTMIKEILLLGNSIYSPLFNNQKTHCLQLYVIFINIILNALQ